MWNLWDGLPTLATHLLVYGRGPDASHCWHSGCHVTETDVCYSGPPTVGNKMLLMWQP